MAKSRKHLRRQRRLLIRAICILFPIVFVLVLSQTAFAKTTYVITDGDRVFTYESFATDPAAVLTEAGLDLDEYDTFTTEASFGSTSLTVQRSQTIAIDWRGDRITAESYGETVDQLLDRLNIYPGEQDVLSVSGEEMTFDGMEIVIARVIREEQTYTAAIPHTTRRCSDDTLAAGEEKVLVPGQDGEVRRTAMVTYVNGEEVAREVTDETVIRSAVEEVIAVGTGKCQAGEGESPSLTIGDGVIILPTGEVLTYTHSDTVEATAYTHTDKGCDMTTATGSTVRWGTVAVDPSRIPYGTRMFIIANDGSYVYGIATAEDCGGDIKGDRMDLYMPTYQQCREFGRRRCTLYFLG